MGRRVALFSALLVGAGSVALTAAPRAGPRTESALVAGFTQGSLPHRWDGPKGPGTAWIDGVINGVASTRASWIRVDLDWWIIEEKAPVNGVHRYDWRAHDYVVDRAHRKGLEVLFVANTTPVWARCSAKNDTCDDVPGPGRNDGKYVPIDANDWKTFIRAAADRYLQRRAGRRVLAWEMWNEANIPEFFLDTTQQDPNVTTYAQRVLTPGYDAVKAAATAAGVSGTQVLTASTAPSRTEWKAGKVGVDAVRYSPYKFLHDLYAQYPTARKFDHVGHHPYVFSYPLPEHPTTGEDRCAPQPNGFPRDVTDAATDRTADGGESACRNALAQLDNLRQIMVTAGESSKQIWSTEVGAPTCANPSPTNPCVTESEQSTIMKRAFDDIPRRIYAGPTFWYSYRDVGTNETNREHHFGVVEEDGTTRKLAWENVRGR